MALGTRGGRSPATPRASRAGLCVPLLGSGHARLDGMRPGGAEVATRHGARRGTAVSLAQRHAGPGSGGTAGVSSPPVPHRPWQGYAVTRRKGEACRPAPSALHWRTCNHPPRAWPHHAAPAQIPQEAWSWSDHARAPSRCAAALPRHGTRPCAAVASAQALALRPAGAGLRATHPQRASAPSRSRRLSKATISASESWP
jgi:hypothetical protein